MGPPSVLGPTITYLMPMLTPRHMVDFDRYSTILCETLAFAAPTIIEMKGADEKYYMLPQCAYNRANTVSVAARVR